MCVLCALCGRSVLKMVVALQCCSCGCTRTFFRHLAHLSRPASSINPLYFFKVTPQPLVTSQLGPGIVWFCASRQSSIVSPRPSNCTCLSTTLLHICTTREIHLPTSNLQSLTTTATNNEPTYMLHYSTGSVLREKKKRPLPSSKKYTTLLSCSSCLSLIPSFR